MVNAVPKPVYHGPPNFLPVLGLVHLLVEHHLALFGQEDWQARLMECHVLFLSILYILNKGWIMGYMVSSSVLNARF